MTRYPSLRQDLTYAGARWTDAEVVTEGAHAHAGAD